MHALLRYQAKLMQCALGTFRVTFEFGISAAKSSARSYYKIQNKILTLLRLSSVDFHRWGSFGITGFPLEYTTTAYALDMVPISQNLDEDLK